MYLHHFQQFQRFLKRIQNLFSMCSAFNALLLKLLIDFFYRVNIV
jgi:hypothetical protein